MRPFVLFVPMAIFITTALVSLINLEGFFGFAKMLNDWILLTFSSLIGWVILLATTAWIMVTFSGVDGVRMLSNVGSLLALFIVIGLQLSLFRMAMQASHLAEPVYDDRSANSLT